MSEHAEPAKAATGDLDGWIREADEDQRVGTWYFYRGAERWELERRSGDDDFGWYLFGPNGSPFGEFLGRRLAGAKAIAQDYAEDYPGARDWVRGGQGGDIYSRRVEEHWRL